MCTPTSHKALNPRWRQPGRRYPAIEPVYRPTGHDRHRRNHRSIPRASRSVTELGIGLAQLGNPRPRSARGSVPTTATTRPPPPGASQFLGARSRKLTPRRLHLMPPASFMRVDWRHLRHRDRSNGYAGSASPAKIVCTRSRPRRHDSSATRAERRPPRGFYAHSPLVAIV